MTTYTGNERTWVSAVMVIAPAKTKTADAAPFIWVVDAFPKDLTKTDYVAADGSKVPYTVGDYRQLADAAFHAGTAPRTRNSYVDEANGLAFYVIDKHRLVEGLLGYTVAVRSTSVAAPEDAAEVKALGGRLSRRVTAQKFEVTNTSSGQAVIELNVTSPEPRATDGTAGRSSKPWLKTLICCRERMRFWRPKHRSIRRRRACSPPRGWQDRPGA